MKLVAVETSTLKLPQWWKDMTLAEKKRYIKEHPTSKYKGALQTTILRDKNAKAKAAGTTKPVAKKSNSKAIEAINKASEELKKLTAKQQKKAVSFDAPQGSGIIKSIGGSLLIASKQETAPEFNHLFEQNAPKGVTKEENEALRGYIDENYLMINPYLRGELAPSKGDAAAERIAKNITSLINKCPPLKEPITVYRGMPASASYIDKLKNNVGKSMLYKGFVSTTMNPDVAGNFADPSYQDLPGHRESKSVMFNITVPKGQKVYAVPPNHAMSTGGEQEVLMKHHQKFNIKKVYLKDGVHHVDMEAA